MSKAIRRRGRVVMSFSLIGLLLWSGWSCADARPPLPTTGPSVTPVPQPSFTRYTLSGRVTDDAGVPISGVFVEVDYHRGAGGFSDPPSNCPTFATFCWLKTHTNANGDYRVTLEAETQPQYPGTIGYVYSFDQDHETQIEMVSSGTANVIQNLRLRRSRRIAAGASTGVSIEPDSSRCSDLEDLFVLGSRCEAIRVDAGAGTLVVEARATTPGGAVPSVYWYTTGNYAGRPQRLEPGVVSIPAGGGTYTILIGQPAETVSAPQNYTVSTLLR